MVRDAATALARLVECEMLIGEEHLVFTGELGPFQDASALRDRYKAALARAGIRRLRFHEYADVGTTTICATRSGPGGQAGLGAGGAGEDGHADIQTTMRYVHHLDRGGEARLLADAFAAEPVLQPGPDAGVKK